MKQCIFCEVQMSNASTEFIASEYYQSETLCLALKADMLNLFHLGRFSFYHTTQ